MMWVSRTHCYVFKYKPFVFMCHMNHRKCRDASFHLHGCNVKHFLCLCCVSCGHKTTKRQHFIIHHRDLVHCVCRKSTYRYVWKPSSCVHCHKLPFWGPSTAVSVNVWVPHDFLEIFRSCLVKSLRRYHKSDSFHPRTDAMMSICTESTVYVSSL